ncbi:MAG: hypothetical protein AUJ51_08905 [Elusimicrobia bacterium CG1_02_56_21]|nr:MAG: hypothetical protein AUJ51_08905 [Elusimicrobia bacterium CG1_02_56_21]
MNNIEKAEELLNNGDFAKALSAIRKSKPDEDKGRRLFLKGEALRGLGLFGEALKEYGFARRAIRGNAELELETRLSEVRCNRALGNDKAAVEGARESAALSRKLGVYTEEAELEWALALRLVGKLPEAARLLEKLLKTFKKAGDWSGAAFALWALGGLYRAQGRYEAGINSFEESLKAAKKGKDEAAAGYALFGLGGILRVAGFMGRALDCYVRARKLFSTTDDAFAKAYAECGTSNVLRQLGRLEDSYAGYIRAHKLYSGLSDWADLGFVEWGMGEIKKKNGDFISALAHYRKAAGLFKGRSEPRGEALTQLSLATLYYLRGETAKAERQHDRALKFIRSHGLHTHLETFT